MLLLFFFSWFLIDIEEQKYLYTVSIWNQGECILSDFYN